MKRSHTFDGREAVGWERERQREKGPYLSDLMGHRRKPMGRAEIGEDVDRG